VTKLDQLKSIQNGRLIPLIESLDFKEVCFECTYFDSSQSKRYRCACLGSCPGITLSPGMVSTMINSVEE